MLGIKHFSQSSQYALDIDVAATRSTAHRMLASIGDVWRYTILIAFSVAVVVTFLAQDFRLAFPIFGLSVLVGIVGTIKVISRQA
jgi:hypothetical protein